MIEHKPRISTLSLFGFEINASIDAGHGNALTFEQVYSGIRDKTLLDDINRILPGSCDFSLFPRGSEQFEGLFCALAFAADSLYGRERRKIGVENSGMCLLMGFTLEALQHKLWQ